MEWAYLIFDLLKGLAWPVVVLVLVLLFRSKLQELIPRVKKAGPSGLEFDTQVQKNIPTSTPGELKRLPLPQTAAISTREKMMHVDRWNNIPLTNKSTSWSISWPKLNCRLSLSAYMAQSTQARSQGSERWFGGRPCAPGGCD